MLKMTYTDTGLCLEYCPQPLELLLSDRVCIYAHAQRSISVQPLRASILLPAALINIQGLQQLQALEIAWCDQDWVEITLTGLWVTEDPEQEQGIFMTELDPRTEQRLYRLWELSQQRQSYTVSGQAVAQCPPG